MDKKEDLDKTVINDRIIDDEFDKTLDAKLADGKQLEATIKVDKQEDNDATYVDVSLTANNDNSQTITIHQKPVTYQQQNVFAVSADSIEEDESSVTTIGSQTTLSSTSEDDTVAAIANEGVEKTLIDGEQDQDKTLAGTEPVEADKTIVDTAVSAGKTLVDKGSLSDSRTITDSRDGAGTSVSTGGGTLSINVRPRSINNSLGETVAGIKQKDIASFSDYELMEKLGEGGMGVVYSARQSSIDRSIALKMIKGDVASEEAKSKFLIEAVVTGDLDHPNIVPVHDLGVDDSGNIFLCDEAGRRG